MTNFVSKLIGFNPLQKQKYVPRSTVFIIELCIVAIAFSINYIILSNSKIDYSSVFPFGVRFSLFIMMIAASFLIFGTHRASIRFTSLKDIIRLFIALTVAMVALTLFNFLYFLNVGEYIFVYAGLLYSGILGLLFLAVFRLSVKYMYIRLKYIKKVGEKRRLLMVGTQHENISVVKAINYTDGGQSRFVGFLSFDKTAKNLRILGLDIWYDQMFYDHFNDEKPVDGVVILGDQKQDEGVVALMDFCIQNRIQIYQSSISRIIENKGNEELQFKKAVLEDLLFREPIVINKNEVDIFLRGKNILVTGAAGSIGSELSRQICQFGPGKLILLDIAETPLFYIENELRDLHPDLEIIAFLGDIGDKEGMEVLFEEDTPDVVLHAAAYKHVPMMENILTKLLKSIFSGQKTSLISVSGIKCPEWYKFLQIKQSTLQISWV
ncbi:MAG: polysaccharide biosynthesis protein [Saprospiraceae bacterium]|nr:polysaccharide biosynthesis protein [Saprospiraceae bacterium]